MRNKFCIFFFEILQFRNVLFQLVSKQLILRYRRTFFGYLWTLFNPLMMMSIMAVVFSSLFKADLKSFSIFLFAGMIPWNFFNSVLTQSSTAFIQNESLIKKIYLPKIIFPLSIAIALLIDSFFSFIALFIIAIAIGGTLSWHIAIIPLVFILLFLFAFGLSLILSIVTVFFRDLQYLINMGMQGLYFLTPILYKKEDLAGKINSIIEINPLTPFIDLFRTLIYYNRLPDLEIIIQTSLISTLSLILGLLFFIFNEKKIVFRL